MAWAKHTSTPATNIANMFYEYCNIILQRVKERILKEKFWIIKWQILQWQRKDAEIFYGKHKGYCLTKFQRKPHMVYLNI